MLTAAAGARSAFSRSIRLRQMPSATYAPVMAAVRVPPSAWSTSQSMSTCRSPIATRSVAARNERPMSRWISCVRPVCLPLAASRSVLVCVERGSIPYSAVTHPRPEPLTWLGTFSSAVALQSTRVRPKQQSTLPSACSVKLGTSWTVRSWSLPRSFLGMGSE